MYIVSHYKYGVKEKVDAYFEDLKKIKKEKKDMENKINELETYKAKVDRDMEQSKREINEKNKYLAEDKVVLKRLSRVKSLSDNIGAILQEYDEDTIKRLLSAYSNTDIMKEEEKIEEFTEEKNEVRNVRKI